MAYIRIPTGMQTVTVTASRKSFIYYQCPNCGQSTLHEYVLKQKVSKSYHAFQSQYTKNSIENEAGEKASLMVEQQDAALYAGINEAHNYELINVKIKCPHCNEIQPWSHIPCKWTKAKFFRLWIVGLVIFSIEILAAMTFAPAAGLMFAPFIILLALLPLFRNIRRKKAMKKVTAAGFVPPVYYNKLNFEELINSPASALLKDMIENTDRK